MNAHIKRWITGAIAAPLIFLLILYGSETAFSCFILLLVVGSVIELKRMFFGTERRWIAAQGTIIALSISLPAFWGNTPLVLQAASLSLILCFLFFLLRIRGESIDAGPLGIAVLSFIGIPLLLTHLILLRLAPHGAQWIFFLVVLAFSGDITAFYTGRRFGKKKLMPHVSPGKTVEGAIGSLAGSLTGCALFRFLFFPSLPLWHLLMIVPVANILGQLGDLAESALKRSAGVKDSGVIFPGHGGILDRLDFFLFAGVFVYYYSIMIFGR
ncbi:MAG: phosphatidate cytidylyltransferase [Syntrophales bacterium]|nr:phosphatidate cytidylyltransferase [Syntrophales bacterium]MDD5531690.1 phosphatidate cytidylyltransferase [Syntrophales bacterium]